MSLGLDLDIIVEWAQLEPHSCLHACSAESRGAHPCVTE